KAPVAAQGSWKCRGRGPFVDEWTALGDSGCEHAGEAVADARGSVARNIARGGGRGWRQPDDRPHFMRERLGRKLGRTQAARFPLRQSASASMKRDGDGVLGCYAAIRRDSHPRNVALAKIDRFCLRGPHGCAWTGVRCSL